MDVRPVADPEEFRAAARSIGQYFGDFPSEEEAARWLETFELERMHGAWIDGEVVGGAGAFTFDFSVPGGTMPCAGVTVVGVYPTHRRRGVLTAMMRAQLEDVRERGEPMAALWASEERIYGRFGYGMASLAGEISIDRMRTEFALPYEPVGRIRIVDIDEAKTLLPPVWDAARAVTPGFFARPAAWWEQRTLRDSPEGRRGGPRRIAVHETGGEIDGYALYRHDASFAENVSTGTLRVGEAIAATPEAMREVWRYILDIDWVQTISAFLLPVDHPLFLLLAEPRRTRYRVHDALWVRLVNIGAALSGRSYGEDGCVVFEVRDEFCPWNAGRWKLDGGKAAATDDEPDLRLDVTGLGSVFLGGFTFAELRRACRVEELQPGAIARADAMFRTDIAPWCPEIF